MLPIVRHSFRIRWEEGCSVEINFWHKLSVRGATDFPVSKSNGFNEL